MTCTVPDVENALDLLRCGYPGRNPRIADDTAQVWHLSLRRFAGPVVVAAATSWPQQRDEFPTLSQFAGHCRATASALAGPKPALGCEDCEAGWVETEPRSVAPCHRCRPPLHAKWVAGELRPRAVPALPAVDPDRLASLLDAQRETYR
jgi:hypothetical protein